ncbi:MAG: hypothetical protein EAZ55_08655 [Cytophagales bacterium]|nr:MAG: hypothetical protein EAZ55_08655 [Cytophagales bacterium]
MNQLLILFIFIIVSLLFSIYITASQFISHKYQYIYIDFWIQLVIIGLPAFILLIGALSFSYDKISAALLVSAFFELIIGIYQFLISNTINLLFLPSRFKPQRIIYIGICVGYMLLITTYSDKPSDTILLGIPIPIAFYYLLLTYQDYKKNKIIYQLSK